MASELRDVEAFVFDVLGTVVNVHGTLVREVSGLAYTRGHDVVDEGNVDLSHNMTITALI
jgi:hypothetical protein